MTTDSKIIAPVINLNGTEGMTLWAQWGDIDRALSELVETLYRAMPHGRDYPNSDYLEAKRQHLSLIHMLESMDEKVHLMRVALYGQLEERGADIPF